jgi:hypothetical protein
MITEMQCNGDNYGHCPKHPEIDMNAPDIYDRIIKILKEDAKGNDQTTDPNALEKIQERTKDNAKGNSES